MDPSGRGHHCADLDTRRSVRRALVYVFQNWKKHGAQVYGDELLDPYSSAFRFKGWSAPHVFFDEDDPFPDAEPRTFLLEKGWRELDGLLHTSEHPTSRPTKRSGRISVSSAPKARRWRIVEPSG